MEKWDNFAFRQSLALDNGACSRVALAVQVEVIEGRQSDQGCRRTAVHADIEQRIT